MSNGVYIGYNSVAKKLKAMYIGVGGVARKIKSAYIGVDGIAREFYTSGVDVANLAISYTGNNTDSIVTMGGVQYRLLTLTSSGTLTIPEEVHGDVWMCSGGSSGHGTANDDSNPGGGAGGFCSTLLNQTLVGDKVAVVGAGTGYISISGILRGGRSSFDGVTTAGNQTYSGNSVSGGTGGGGYRYGAGQGDGISKYPFLETTYFLPHCAGGGAGALWREVERETGASSIAGYHGGDGGTNGGNGTKATALNPAPVSTSEVLGGAGGNYGGGHGAGANRSASGIDAFFYGGGGGGTYVCAIRDTDGDWDYTSNFHGCGYQGVIYVRIPVNQ